MPSETIRVLSADCTVTVDATDRHEYRGHVLVIVKPDNTVLVHDTTGYQPVAWLTRADGVMLEPDENGATLKARKDGTTVRLEAHGSQSTERYPASSAGRPVGPCPDCDGALVRATDIHCLDCGEQYGIPADADLLDRPCECGLPRMRVRRGLAFDLCIDRACESLDDAVRGAFDEAWDCPDCDGMLSIIRRGGLIAGCEHYPECEVAFAVPTGVVDGECDCGLPLFDTGSANRCLNASCST